MLHFLIPLFRQDEKPRLGFVQSVFSILFKGNVQYNYDIITVAYKESLTLPRVFR